MALIPTADRQSYPFQVHRFPQDHYIDALRWLPQISAFHRHIVLATFDSDNSTSSLQTLAFTPNSNSDINSGSPPKLTHHASQLIQSRITSLKTLLTPQSSKPLIAASTFSGSLLFLTTDLLNGSLDCEFSVPEKGFHSGSISGIDLSENGRECVSVGKDGKINLVSIGSGERGNSKTVFDSNGLVSYTTVKWASPVEFVTGGLGFTLHWWDQRRPGGPVSQFKPNW